MARDATTEVLQTRWHLGVPDQAGRIALVTGCTGAIGQACVRRLGLAGSEVILGVRDEAKGERLAHHLRQEIPQGAFRVECVDLADLESIRALAGRLIDQGRRLSLILNTARTFVRGEHTLSADGYELHFAVNHLAPFALAGLLLPLLRAQAGGARVITVGARRTHRRSFELGDLQSPRPAEAAYVQSKLAQLIFTRELDRRSRAYQWNVSAVAAHPGSVAREELANRLRAWDRLLHLTQTPAEGALPLLMAATDPDVRSGEYYGPVHPLGRCGPPGLVPMPAQVADRTVGHTLWEMSERLTGVPWPSH